MLRKLGIFSFSGFEAGSVAGMYLFPAAQVQKKDGSTLFTTKAHNGRVVVEWVARCLTDAATQTDRFADDRLPLLASCASLACINTPCFSGALSLPFLQGLLFVSLLF